MTTTAGAEALTRQEAIMEALSPQGHQNGMEVMAAKILLAVAMTMSVTAGGLATWTLQGDPVVLDRSTWVPLGVVVAVLLAGIGAAIRASRYLDSRDGRIESLEENQDTIMVVLLGTTNPEEGIRRGGMVDKVDRILKHLERDDD